MATGSVGESRDMSKVPHRRGDMAKSSIAVYKPKKAAALRNIPSVKMQYEASVGVVVYGHWPGPRH